MYKRRWLYNVFLFSLSYFRGEMNLNKYKYKFHKIWAK